jgi:pSer/pThr/pTyr-binding forkhead associated (FHA) protein
VCWLEWGRQRFALPTGEHVVGRDPGVRIRLDASSVSRRHARLIVTPTGAVLEDFGSKNGTYRGDERVTSPIRLADGDEIRIGTELVTVRLRSDDDALDTKTVDIDI